MERAVWDVGSKVETWLRTAPARQAAELLAALGLQPDTNPSMPGVVFDLYRSLPDPDKGGRAMLPHPARHARADCKQGSCCVSAFVCASPLLSAFTGLKS